MNSQFLQAVRAHQAGQLAEAERLYRDILRTDPRHADSLHLLGVIATQIGQHAQAVDMIRAAIAIKNDTPAFHANLGTCFRHLGRLAEAADSYAAALRLKPDYADAHNNLGTVQRILGQTGAAERSFRQALQFNPRYAEAYNNIGNLLRETGKPEEAEPCFRKALEFSPLGHPKTAQYNANLALVFRDLGRMAEAEAAYVRSLKIDPEDPETQQGLGALLRDLNRLEEAEGKFLAAITLQPAQAGFYVTLAETARFRGSLDRVELWCRRALALDPNAAAAQNTLGSLLLDLGRIDLAQFHLERAVAREPDTALYHYNLGQAKRYRAEDPALKSMEALFGRIETLPERERVYLEFALGKAYEDAGQRDLSFSHLLSANRLKRKATRYDEARTGAQFERIRAVFTANLIGEKSVAAPANGPIFIVGMQRSGSTLIEQVLASHPQVFGAGEVELFKSAVLSALGADAYPSTVPGLSRADLDRLGAQYRAAMSRESSGASRTTDKLLRNFQYCGLIHLALPNARIIHTRRDPVDTCLSIFSKLFAGDIPYAYDLAELGRYYRLYAGLMTHWHETLPEGVMIDLDYEEVVGDLETQARRVLAHCGLEWDDACLAFHETARPVRTASAIQVRQPVYKSSVGRWRPAADLLAPLTDALSA